MFCTSLGIFNCSEGCSCSIQRHTFCGMNMCMSFAVQRIHKQVISGAQQTKAQRQHFRLYIQRFNVFVGVPFLIFCSCSSSSFSHSLLSLFFIIIIFLYYVLFVLISVLLLLSFLVVCFSSSSSSSSYSLISLFSPSSSFFSTFSLSFSRCFSYFLFLSASPPPPYHHPLTPSFPFPSSSLFCFPRFY